MSATSPSPPPAAGGLSGPRPLWLTFDCYGTLIQWDEGLLAAIRQVLAGKQRPVEPARFIAVYDRHEHALEEARPHLDFRTVAGRAMAAAMTELGLEPDPADAAVLTDSIGRMPPFPEVVESLARLKAAGFRLAVISNTDDAIIAGNIAQLGGHVDRVITAQQAGAYKPSRTIFEHGWRTLSVTREEIVHVCASPHLDLAAARDLGFRAVWVDRDTGRRPLPDYRPDATVPALDAVPGVLAAAGWM